MSTSSPTQTTLRKYASDLMSLQSLFMTSLEKQQEAESLHQKEAKQLLSQILQALKEQRPELEARLSHLGGNLKDSAKSKLAEFAGTASGMFDTVRTDPVSKMLRDDYALLSMMIVGYKMLMTSAMTAQDEQLVKITEKHLNRLAQLITETSKVVPMVVAAELEVEPGKASSIGKQAVERTHRAWSQENIKAGSEIVSS